MLYDNMRVLRSQVFAEFGGLCIGVDCRESAAELHHLIPRGVIRYKLESLNCVPTCHSCHESRGRVRGDEVTGKIFPGVKEKSPERWEWYNEHKNEVRSGAQKLIEEAA